MRSTPLLPLVLLLLLNLGRAISNHAVPSSLGGIDMSELEVEMSAGCDPSVAGCEVVEPLVSIELRALDPTTHAPPRPMGGTKSTEADALADSYHVRLAMPQDSFWVNHAPTESHRVIDSELGRTEVGKVMLDADLALKRTAATLLHPDHDVGAAFWDELYGWVGARPARLCHSFRQWIVPGVATMQITPARCIRRRVRRRRRRFMSRRFMSRRFVSPRRASRAASAAEGDAGGFVRERRGVRLSRRRRVRRGERDVRWGGRGRACQGGRAVRAPRAARAGGGGERVARVRAAAVGVPGGSSARRTSPAPCPMLTWTMTWMLTRRSARGASTRRRWRTSRGGWTGPRSRGRRATGGRRRRFSSCTWRARREGSFT